MIDICILQLYGLKLALDSVSIRELRSMFGAYNKRSWYRLIADMKDATITRQQSLSSPFKVIRDYLEEFEATTKKVLHIKKINFMNYPKIDLFYISAIYIFVIVKHRIDIIIQLTRPYHLHMI